MKIDRTHILVLNYNGQALLAECLPSILAAARAAPVPCRVTVIDNGSTDDSLSVLESFGPALSVVRCSNRGLASFNEVLSAIDEPVALLLNNDVKLDEGAVGPLLEAIASHPDALFSAPQCWTFDDQAYEGMRTRVRSRFGLVQGRCRVPGHERVIDEPDLTAAAGPVLAVDRVRFLALGGFDDLYFPGRIEDLDLGFRGWMAGWRGYYEPRSRAWHLGFGSFGPELGRAGCDVLALRNTLLFSWKNLGGRRLRRHLAWLAVRLAHALLTLRAAFLVALGGALRRLGPVLRERRRQRQGVRRGLWLERQEAFFRRFSW